MSQALDDYLGRFEQRWQMLRDAAERVGVAGLDQTTASGWSGKEMIAHIAFWEEAAPYVIEHMLRGKPEPDAWPFASGYDPLAVDEEWPADTVHNAREAAWAREQPSSVVLERLDRAHERLREVLGTLEDDELAQHAAYLGEVHEHFSEHLDELRAITDSAEGRRG